MINVDRNHRGEHHTLQLACTVADADLFLGAYFQTAIGLNIVHMGKFSTFYVDYLHHEEPRAVEEADLEDIRFFYYRIDNIEEQYHHIKTAVDELEKLRWLSDSVLLKHLGYFAVLELVLTHPPKPTDPTDSVTRQIRSKLSLIENRTPNPLQLTEMFDGARFKTVIDKLYSYRSKIAHGVRPDFDGELQLLRSKEHAHSVIKMVAKRVVQQALCEPQLLTDLKGC